MKQKNLNIRYRIWKGMGQEWQKLENNSHYCSTALKGIQGLHEKETQVVKQQYMLVIQ